MTKTCLGTIEWTRFLLHPLAGTMWKFKIFTFNFIPKIVGSSNVYIIVHGCYTFLFLWRSQM